MSLFISVPNSETLKLMVQREQEIQSLPQVQRAFAQSYLDKPSTMYQIKLRVVREFGLPDSTVDVLQNTQYYYNDSVSGYVDQSYHPLERHRRSASPPLMMRGRRQNTPPKPVQCVSPITSPTKTYRSALTEVWLCYSLLVTCMKWHCDSIPFFFIRNKYKKGRINAAAIDIPIFCTFQTWFMNLTS